MPRSPAPGLAAHRGPEARAVRYLPLDRGPRAPVEEEIPEQEYWLSFSDLLAGLLMVFALVLLSALYSLGTRIDDYREEVEARQSLISRIESELQQSGLEVAVDSVGTVVFDGALFPEAESNFVPGGRDDLEAFATSYLDLVFGSDLGLQLQKQLDAIVVEGHTNDNGSYISNLRLSQDRAFAVMEVLLDVARAGAYEGDLKRYVTANGRSFAELRCEDGSIDDQHVADAQSHLRCSGPGQGGVDKEKSRRIAIRFRLDDRDLVERILTSIGS